MKRIKNKFSVRSFTSCSICRRVRAVFEKEELCRICYQKHARSGFLPGVKKISW